MMRYRDLLAVVGIGLGMVGLGFTLWPAVAAGVTLADLPVTGVGLVALLAAIWGYRARRRARFLRADPPAVEDPPEYAPPGEDLQATLHGQTGPDLAGTTKRREARKRLRSLAIEVLEVTEDCDRSAAVEMLEEGAWTDDRRAAALFVSEPPSSLRDVVRGLLSSRSWFVIRATHAIEELRVRLEGGT